MATQGLGSSDASFRESQDLSRRSSSSFRSRANSVDQADQVGTTNEKTHSKVGQFLSSVKEWATNLPETKLGHRVTNLAGNVKNVAGDIALAGLKPLGILKSPQTEKYQKCNDRYEKLQKGIQKKRGTVEEDGVEGKAFKEMQDRIGNDQSRVARSYSAWKTSAHAKEEATEKLRDARHEMNLAKAEVKDAKQKLEKLNAAYQSLRPENESDSLGLDEYSSSDDAFDFDNDKITPSDKALREVVIAKNKLSEAKAHLTKCEEETERLEGELKNCDTGESKLRETLDEHLNSFERSLNLVEHGSDIDTTSVKGHFAAAGKKAGSAVSEFVSAAGEAASGAKESIGEKMRLRSFISRENDAIKTEKAKINDDTKALKRRSEKVKDATEALIVPLAGLQQSSEKDAAMSAVAKYINSGKEEDFNAAKEKLGLIPNLQSEVSSLLETKLNELKATRQDRDTTKVWRTHAEDVIKEGEELKKDATKLYEDLQTAKTVLNDLKELDKKGYEKDPKTGDNVKQAIDEVGKEVARLKEEFEKMTAKRKSPFDMV